AVLLFNLGQADAAARSENAAAAQVVAPGVPAIADRRLEQACGGVRIAGADEARDEDLAGDGAGRMGWSRVRGQPQKVGLPGRLEQDLQRPRAAIPLRLANGPWCVTRG